ncbi:MAG: hypothetical protein ACOVKO_09330 [Elstera sp.]
MIEWAKNRRAYALTVHLVASGTLGVLVGGLWVTQSLAQAPRFQMNIGGSSSVLGAPDPEICRQALATLSASESATYQPGVTASGGTVAGADLPGGALYGGGLAGGLSPSTRLYVDPNAYGSRLRGPLQGETTVGTVQIAPDGTSLLNGRPLTGGNEDLIERCRIAGYR